MIKIIGLSCRYPESENSYEFFENLKNSVDMVTENKHKNPNIPNRSGKIKNRDYFDNLFFNINGKQASKMDPQLRFLLETSYEALIDAGINIDKLKGSNTGVYIGSCGSDYHQNLLYETEDLIGYEHTGCAQSMYANRLSFFYDLHGPSLNIDTACSSSLVALCNAFNDIHTGKCDYAIVGGTSILLNDSGSIAFNKLKMLSPDGKCKSFDKSANGYVRSEGIGCVILTNKQNTYYKPYATILGCGINSDGFTKKGITFPNGIAQQKLYEEVMRKINIDPSQVSYIEAHGTGTVAGDGQELMSLYNIFGKNRKIPLKIGSVKSNMGHSEGASGLAGLIKLMLCYNQKMLVPNLHFNNPNQKIKDMVVVNSVTKWNGGISAINSFGFGGTNSNVFLTNKKTLIELHNEINDLNDLNLTFLSSHTKEGLENLKKMLTLENSKNIFTEKNKNLSNYRSILNINEPIEKVLDTEQKICFICSGNGSQWNGMSKELYIQSKIFKESIDACGKSINFEIGQLILSEKEKNALEKNIMLTSIQIGLINLLKHYNITPDYYIGHSAGEFPCSYLDEVTDLQNTMKISLYRSSVGKYIENPNGLMITIGINKDELNQLKELYPDLEVACLNSNSNVTLSGNKDLMNKIFTEITEGKTFLSKETFIRKLNTNNYAYHSSQLDVCMEPLQKLINTLNYLKENKSEKWISTLESETYDQQYWVNTFRNTVYFERAINRLPDNVIFVEIGPHSILRTFIPKGKTYINLMKRNTNSYDSVRLAINRLWSLGVNMDIKQNQFGKERLPLNIRPYMTSWDKNCFPVSSENKQTKNQNGIIIKYDISKNDSYILDHNIDGRPLMPAVSYLFSVWEAYSKMKNKNMYQLNIQFLDVDIHQAVQIHKESKIEFKVIFGNGIKKYFELINENEKIISGYVTEIKKPIEIIKKQQLKPKDTINNQSFYNMIRRSGYNYGNKFRLLNKLNTDGNYAEIENQKINGREVWIPFLDNILHISLFENLDGILRVPISFRSFNIFGCEEIDKSVLVIKKYNNTLISNYCSVSGIDTNIIGKKNNKKEFKEINQKIMFQPYQNLNDNDLLLDKYSQAVLYYLKKSIKGNLESGHLLKVQKILNNYPEQELNFDVELFINNHINDEKSVLLRMIRDILNPEIISETLKNPIQKIVSHSEHEKFYALDYLCSIKQKSYDKIMNLIIENKKKINICEFGTGTGGFTKNIINNIFIQKYLATDITMGFMNSLDKNIGNSELVTKKKWNINEKFVGNEKFNLVIGSNALHTCFNLDKTIQNIYEILEEEGFLLLSEFTDIHTALFWGLDKSCWNFDITENRDCLWISQKKWKYKLESNGFTKILHLNHGSQTLLLYHKNKKIKSEAIINIDNRLFSDWSKEYLKKINEVDKIWLVGNDKGLPSLTKCLSKEKFGEKISCIYLSDTKKIEPSNMEIIRKKNMLINVIKGKKVGGYLSEEITNNEQDEEKKGYISFPKPGDLGKIKWNSLFLNESKNIECKVTFSALNFRDVMLASGKINTDTIKNGFSGKNTIGSEFSGVSNNKKIMGFAKNTFSSHVYVKEDMVWEIPKHLTLEQAASIPTVYATSYYSLIERARIEKGDSILIHAGTGGVGLSAIQIALNRGLEVFTTCSTSEKKQFLLNRYPLLKEKNIGQSRDTTFEEMIMKETKGKGVDVVLNSLADDKLLASIRCVKQHGHFLEIGKYDLMNNTRIGIKFLLKNITFHGIDVDQVFTHPKKWKKVWNLVNNGLQSSEIIPLPTKIFKSENITDAFRFMGSGKHIGKVLVDCSNINIPKTITNKFQAESSKTYIITGGLGGFGLELAKWLSEHGAKHLVLTSRSGINNGEKKYKVEQIRNTNVKVDISTLDVSDINQCQELFSTINNLGGIFHLAMVLQDSLFINMNQQKWDNCVKPKADACINLDTLSRKKNCEYFVVFSSISSGKGNVGQSNYGYANSIMEQICLQRKQENLHSLCIQWGVIGDVGYAVNNIISKEFQIFAPQNIQDCLSNINEYLYNYNTGIYTRYNINRRKLIKKNNDKNTLLQKIGSIVDIDLSKLNKEYTLERIGIDSIQIIEIQSLLDNHLNKKIPVNKLQQITINELIKMDNQINNSVENTNNTQNKMDIKNQHKLIIKNNNYILLDGTHKKIFTENIFNTFNMHFDEKHKKKNLELPNQDELLINAVLEDLNKIPNKLENILLYQKIEKENNTYTEYKLQKQWTQEKIKRSMVLTYLLQNENINTMKNYIQSKGWDFKCKMSYQLYRPIFMSKNGKQIFCNPIYQKKILLPLLHHEIRFSIWDKEEIIAESCCYYRIASNQFHFNSFRCKFDLDEMHQYYHSPYFQEPYKILENTHKFIQALKELNINGSQIICSTSIKNILKMSNVEQLGIFPYIIDPKIEDKLLNYLQIDKIPNDNEEIVSLDDIVWAYKDIFPGTNILENLKIVSNLILEGKYQDYVLLNNPNISEIKYKKNSKLIIITNKNQDKRLREKINSLQKGKEDIYHINILDNTSYKYTLLHWINIENKKKFYEYHNKNFL